MSERNYLIFDDALRDPELRPVFDAAVAQVNDGTARVRGLNGEYPMGLIVDGRGILGRAVLEYALGLVPADSFDDAVARAFTERMRLLFGWNVLEATLNRWVEKRLRDPFFVNDGGRWKQNWVLRPDADARHLPESFFRFACYIAIAHLKHGPSYASVATEQIFDWVTQLGSPLPAQLKKRGTGELPGELAVFRGEDVTAKANDALRVVRITITQEREDAYSTALDYLCRLLETTDFPRSYAIEFRGPTKTYLPIKGLPEKGVHQFFAAAAAYPSLHAAIERYAIAATREFEWYTNIDDENCAMPGTFAVFALGLADSAHSPLVLGYLRTVDGEHQSVHGRFAEAYIETHGFTPEAIAYLLVCAGNIQHLEHRKSYPALIANRDSLEALLRARRGLTGSEPSTISEAKAKLGGERVPRHVWAHLCYAIWGRPAESSSGAATIVEQAPEDLRPLYRQVLA